MFRFAASLVYPVSSPPVVNAVVTLDENGIILSVEGGSPDFRERAGVEFYSGILIPGLADVLCGDKDSAWLASRGVRIAGRTGFPKDAVRPSDDPLFHARWKGRCGGMIGYHVYDDIDCFQKSFNPGRYEGLFHAVGPEGLPVLASSGKMEMIDLMFRLQEGEGKIGLPQLITMGTLNGARALGSRSAGCLLPGKQPGLNIIEGADIKNLRLMPGSRLRRLC